jgi:UDP-3-O-[3-hydroxymyristoyl] N-acetylglucosamine deacetylase
MDWVSFHGRGLHSGALCGVQLALAPGAVHFETVHGPLGLDALHVARTDRGVKLVSRAFEFELDLVEHLLAAFGGLGIYKGVAIRAFGPEVPLLDGGALSFATALRALDVTRSAPRLRVAHEARIVSGASIYDFEPAKATELVVQVEFAQRGPESATWNGSAAEFTKDFAPARTFGFRSEHEALLTRGRASHVDPESVLILEDDGSVLPPASAPTANELARHKLLDLVGDLYFFGGPPVGRIRAARPGHTATHAAIRRALDDGILDRTRPSWMP